MKFKDLSYKDLGRPITETDIKFDVYRNYLKLISQFIKEKHNTQEDFVNFLWQNIDLKELSGIDEKIMKRFLYIGWNTEFLSTLNDKKEVEFLKINNHWKPIQSYYAIYSIGEAVSFLIDKSLKESHRGCLNKLDSFLVERIKIEPWCFAYSGTLSDGFMPKNFPLDVKVISDLQRLDVEPANMIATCLKAEHRNIIKKFEPKKLSETEKSLGQKKKLKKEYNPGYTTILDFLYRLRIKSNYKDVEIFITDAPDDDIKGFSNDLSFIVFYTLILFEVIIIKRYGLNNFLRIAKDYSKKIDSQTYVLNKRIGFYEKINKPF